MGPEAGSQLHLPQHPDEHRPEDPILLAVDQDLGEGAGREWDFAGSDGRAAVPGRRSAWGCVRIVIGVDWKLEHAMSVTARRCLEAAGSPLAGW